MPHCKYVLSEVDYIGGMAENGATKIHQSFEYKSGHYNRYERTFFGFDTIVSNQYLDGKVYRKTIQTYDSKDFYRKDLPVSETVLNAKMDTIISTKNTYLEEKKTGSHHFVLQEKSQTRFQAGGSQTTIESYKYDEYDNVIAYKSVAGNVLESRIDYHKLETIKNVPKSVQVIGNDEVLRKRESQVDGKGNITQITLSCEQAQL